MDLSRAAILPIDMQAAFDAPPWPARWNQELDTNALRLLEGARAAARPIIHVRHSSVEPGSTLRAGTPGHTFRPGFEPRPGEELLTKSVNAAFIGTDLDLRLRRLGVDTVITFGFTTDMCVSTTVRVGANLGWRMVLVEDACDCFDLPDSGGDTITARQVHAAHVATLAFEFATVITTEAILEDFRAARGVNGPVRSGP